MDVTRRDLLRTGVAAGTALSAGSFATPRALQAQGRRGGILRVRGYDPPHFDPHLAFNPKLSSTVSFVYSKLVRFKVGPGVAPGVFTVEPDLAERWEQPDDTTYVFFLRKGVRWHDRPPVNGRELTAEDVKFTFERFLGEKANPHRYLLDSVDRVEATDRYTVRFRLKEPFVWLLSMLASAWASWIVAREAVDKFGDLKKPEAAIGTGPFVLVRHEPNVKTVFRRNPDYYRPGSPWVDGVEWQALDDDAAGFAAYVTGQLDLAPFHWWTVRQQDVPTIKKNHPTWSYQDFLTTVNTVVYMRTDQPPFNDVRVRRAISHAVDRQAIIDAVLVKGEPTPAVSRGLPEWSLPVAELGRGAQYYRHDPKEARRLLAEAGFPRGLKTQLSTTSGLGPDLVDAVQLVQRQLKDGAVRHLLGAPQPPLRPVPARAAAQLESCERSEDHRDAEGADAHARARRSTEDHLRHPAVCRRAAVLRVPLHRRLHGLLAAAREELCAEPELRLRQPRRRAVARTVARRRTS
jgi:peptide/nickel transport system substrate-binding protein